MRPFPLPYTAPEPPAELFRDVLTTSGRSNTEAFDKDIDTRDMFLGKRRCVICGLADRVVLQRCHIVPPGDPEVWDLLKKLGWVPVGGKANPEHECRNGLTMCSNHQKAFDYWQFFIRFEPKINRYIFVHYDSYDVSPGLAQFDGKAVALDPNDKDSPLPLLFLIHEYMARGRNFYQLRPTVGGTHGWQDWITTDGVVHEAGDGFFTFNRTAPTSSGPALARQPTNLHDSPTSVPPPGSIYITPPTDELVQQLMSVQHTLPSWKVWQQETMTWEGTAEENIKRYVENVGVNSDLED